jgi:hypothetical protein
MAVAAIVGEIVTGIAINVNVLPQILTGSSPTTIYTSTPTCHQHKITEFSIDLGDNATNEGMCGKTECSEH